MTKYLFMKPVLEHISRGNVFSKAFAIILRVLAVVIAIAGLVGSITIWKQVSQVPAVVLLGVLVFQLFYALAIYMAVHTLLIRAKDIAELPESEFTVIPIVSIFLKLIGELYACFGIIMAFAVGILLWFMGDSALFLLRTVIPFAPNFGGGQGFWGGILFIVGGLGLAFIVLVSFYLLAESVVVLVDIARNLKATRQIAVQYDKANVNP